MPAIYDMFWQMLIKMRVFINKQSRQLVKKKLAVYLGHAIVFLIKHNMSAQLSLFTQRSNVSDFIHVKLNIAAMWGDSIADYANICIVCRSPVTSKWYGNSIE